MQAHTISASLSASYHRQREAEECELAVAATDAAVRRGHFERAENHAALMQAAQGPHARHARRPFSRSGRWPLVVTR